MQLYKITVLFSSLALAASVSVFAGPGKDKKPAMVTEVWTCPTMACDFFASETNRTGNRGIAYKGKKGAYKLHFCCPACPVAFAKLSDKEKETSVAFAVKKDSLAKK